MDIGDLVTWKKEEVSPDPSKPFPWHYNNWDDIGLVTDFIDIDTRIVQWCSGSKFPVWIIDLSLLSKNNMIKKD